jgi:hypothetical protein
MPEVTFSSSFREGFLSPNFKVDCLCLLEALDYLGYGLEREVVVFYSLEYYEVGSFLKTAVEGRTSTALALLTLLSSEAFAIFSFKLI